VLEVVPQFVFECEIVGCRTCHPRKTVFINNHATTGDVRKRPSVRRVFNQRVAEQAHGNDAGRPVKSGTCGCLEAGAEEQTTEEQMLHHWALRRASAKPSIGEPIASQSVV